jgi:hypothetical protein
MFKVTNTGIYEKIAIRVRGKAVFYMRAKSESGKTRSQKECLHTRFHDWLYTKNEALKIYKARTGREFEGSLFLEKELEG